MLNISRVMENYLVNGELNEQVICTSISLYNMMYYFIFNSNI